MREFDVVYALMYNPRYGGFWVEKCRVDSEDNGKLWARNSWWDAKTGINLSRPFSLLLPVNEHTTNLLRNVNDPGKALRHFAKNLRSRRTLRGWRPSPF